MYNIIAQIVLARRSNDSGSWMNILIVVIMAAFWIIGGIVKSRQKQSAGQEKQPPRTPTPQPPAPARAAPMQSPRPTQPRPATTTAGARPRTSVQRPAARRTPPRSLRAQPGPPIPQMAQPEQPTSTPPPQMPDVGAEQIPHLDRKLLSDLETKPVTLTPKAPTPERLVEPLVHLANAAELRTAILHYEVFGKPLALRGPSEHLIGQ
ncbi:MAG: hypothetical protein JSU70_18920 [Phycisphaerales bacterium]|nr:MAG: hypothetical protein JSU70_18920 [Phycisphaerales bacterium]